MGQGFLKLVLPLCLVLPAFGQSHWQPGPTGLGFSSSGNQAIQLVSSAEQSVKANRSQQMTLRFAIGNGLHIQSHTPHSRFLIPTALHFDAPAGVTIARIGYPAGEEYHFAFAPNQTLSVYTGQFAVRVNIQAKPGHYVLHGRLKYQACDIRACRPPKTLPLTLQVMAMQVNAK